jgi:small multidrug resistance pump
MRPYVALAVAIAAEIVGTTSLKLSEGFSNAVPGVAVVLGYGGSFYCLGLALEELPIGLVYAVWSGVGVVGTALVGVAVFEERVDPAGALGLALIVAGVAVLALLSEAYAPAH